MNKFYSVKVLHGKGKKIENSPRHNVVRMKTCDMQLFRKMNKRGKNR